MIIDGEIELVTTQLHTEASDKRFLNLNNNFRHNQELVCKFYKF